MKILAAPAPSAEQLEIIGQRRPGAEIIRGAAGSGKTTTALLRLQNLSNLFRARHIRKGVDRPVKVLMLTFNRTLKGYVEALAQQQAAVGSNLELEVDTFSHWAMQKLGGPHIHHRRTDLIQQLASGRGLNLRPNFLQSEIEYIIGRFPEASRNNYLSMERTGRGGSPRVEKPTRMVILSIIEEYKTRTQGSIDWNDLALLMGNKDTIGYDIAIVDEAQDFSANQIRAVRHHLNVEHALTLVIDTVQRLYPRGYTWAEVGIDARTTRFHRLRQNHRNTVEIARFARGILEGLAVDDDGTMPDLDNATRHGVLPIVVRGCFSKQVRYAVDYIRSNVNLEAESVAFLHSLGGGWFRATREALSGAGLSYEEISREEKWPEGPANIGLCTMHSAKGLEFDHVIIIGFSKEATPHGPDEDDHQREILRRLLAMAVARARYSVVVGFKPGEASSLVDHFAPGTYKAVEL